MKKINWQNLFYIFVIGSIIGWFVEGVYTLIKKNMLINHSALVLGPFNLIYGFGAVILTLALYKFKKSSYLKQFIISFICGSVLEYVTSWGMETFLGFTAWNYKRYFLNINGRICPLYSCFWGFLGVFWINFVYPTLDKFIERIKKIFGPKLIIVLISFLVFDFGLSVSAIVRAKQKDRGIEAKNIYDRFLDNTFNSDYLKNMFNNHWK